MALCKVDQAHADMLAFLMQETPTRVCDGYPVDDNDLARRELHLRAVTTGYMRYIRALVDDLNEHNDGGKRVDCTPLVTAICRDLNELLYKPLEAMLKVGDEAQ
jgi:hypothetical protein